MGSCQPLPIVTSFLRRKPSGHKHCSDARGQVVRKCCAIRGEHTRGARVLSARPEYIARGLFASSLQLRLFPLAPFPADTSLVAGWDLEGSSSPAGLQQRASPPSRRPAQTMLRRFGAAETYIQDPMIFS